MKAEYKDKWVAALRSGQYPQGQSYLKTPEGYCCLGVLCEVFIGKDAFNEHYHTAGVIKYHSLKVKYANISTLPLEISEAVEITQSESGHLMALNDYEKMPFPKIADYIENNIPST